MKSWFRGLLSAPLYLTSLGAAAQPAHPAPPNLYRLRRADDGLHFLYYDSSTSKSTVVEFQNFLVLLEVAGSNEGGARHLRDHPAIGRRVLATLAHHFPGKPLRYVAHSHWHPHSLSSVAPFLAAGCTIVSTEANFAIIRGFADSVLLRRATRQIRLVTGDSLVIADRRQRLVAYRFSQKNYPATPTPDYLFFRLPRYGLLHVGYMFTRVERPLVGGRALLTGRAEDVSRFVAARRLHPRGLIRLPVEPREPTDIVPIGALTNVIKNGVRGADLVARYRRLPLATLTGRQDRLVAAALADSLPASVLNTAVYQALAARELPQAQALAHLQAHRAPADPNAWDTLGETCYFRNQRALAHHYARLARRLDPHGTAGDEKAWEQDLKDHEQLWRAAAKP